LAFRYIFFHYFKFFVIILGALSMFFVGFDYMGNSAKLPSSSNLVLLYLVYKTFFAIDLLLPLSLVFAMVSTKINFIRSNALVSFYSLGYSKFDILKPFIALSVLMTIIFVSLHNIPKFANANELATNIKKNSEYLSPSRDLFFIYKNKYIYFRVLKPLQQKAFGIRIFKLKDKKLKEVIVAKSAFYNNNFWHIKNADVIIKPDSFDFNSKGMEVKSQNELKILKGFRPKMLDQVYEGSASYTIKDALEAYFLLKSENINLEKIKAVLYKSLIYPFYAPFLVIIIFFFVPISARFLNVSIFSFIAIVSSLLIWGVLFMLSELSKNETIPPEIGILLPIVILFLTAIRFLKKASVIGS